MSQERVMLLIDADNLSVDVMEQAVRLLLNQHGGLHVRRAYCTAESAVANQSAFKRLGIKPMVNLAAGKNSTDIAMAVDAIDLVLSERPDVVVIASSDSDFAPLVQRLREKGCVVRGIGQKGKVGDETQDVYDDYTVIEHRGGGSRVPGRAPGRSATPAARAPRPSRARAARPEVAAVPAAAAQGAAARGRGRGRSAGPAAPVDEAWAAAPAPSEPARPPQVPAEPAPMVAAVLAALAPAEPPPTAAAAPAPAATGTPGAADEKQAVAGPETAADAAAKATPAKPATKRAPRARKTAAGAAAPAAAEPAAAADEAAPATPAPARSRARKPKVAAAEPAAPEAVAPPAPAPAPEPAPAPPPPPPQAPRPAPAAPVSPTPTAPAERTPPPRVTLQAVLNCLPELARGQSIALNVAVQRLREARLLGKNSSSLKLFSQFSDSLDLLPARNPSRVRLRA